MAEAVVVPSSNADMRQKKRRREDEVAMKKLVAEAEQPVREMEKQLKQAPELEQEAEDEQDQKQGGAEAEQEEEQDQEPGEFVVERIVTCRRRRGAARQTLGYEYLVKWKNWPEADNTWEPPEHFDAAMLKAFHRRRPEFKLR